MFNKFLKILLICSMALLLVACNNANKQQGAEKLIVATNAEFPPYEYKDGNNFLGIDIEITKAIADKLGKEVEYLDIAFDSIIPAVQSGKADIAAAGMTVTEDRQQFVNFSDTYQTAVQSIIVMENSSITSVDDLSGKLIGVQLGNTADIYASEDYGEDAVKRYPKILDAIQSMISGKIDACIVDDQVAKACVEQINSAGNNKLKILETAYAEEEYAFAFNKDNVELMNKVNEIIKQLKEDGTFKNIVDKYIKVEK